MATMIVTGRLVLRIGMLALMAGVLAQPARAEMRFAPEQKAVAERALTRAQTARDGIKEAQEKSGETASQRQERLLAKADMELSRAARYYEAGRYELAARVADRAAWLIAKASLVPGEVPAPELQ
jgi:hypothetical protein